MQLLEGELMKGKSTWLDRVNLHFTDAMVHKGENDHHMVHMEEQHCPYTKHTFYMRYIQDRPTDSKLESWTDWASNSKTVCIMNNSMLCSWTIFNSNAMNNETANWKRWTTPSPVKAEWRRPKQIQLSSDRPANWMIHLTPCFSCQNLH